MNQEMKTPILIVGGGTGGVAAALAVARMGQRCIVTEPTDWIGGQLTSQAVPPDENQWIEDSKPGQELKLGQVQSASRSYLQFREAVRQWYRDHRPLTEAAASNARLNPGNGWVSHLCFEPRVGHEVLLAMLGEAMADGRVQLLLEHEPIEAFCNADDTRIEAMRFRSLRDASTTTITADVFIDATELGDVYPLAKVEHLVGAEHRDVYGELHGREDYSDPLDQQAISWCFAMEHEVDAEGEVDHRIEKPAGYDEWKQWVPPLEPAWPGPLFSWICGVDDEAPKELNMVPWPDEPKDGQWELWRYRRIVDRGLYREEEAGAYPDVSLTNCVQMDYFRKPLLYPMAGTVVLGPTDGDVAYVDFAEGQRRQAEALQGAREQSLCWFYWLQTDAPRHDGESATGYSGLKLSGETLGTQDGFAKAAYIREPRRLLAKTMIAEGHVGHDQRVAAGVQVNETTQLAQSHRFEDSVGIGHYRLDLHPSTSMRNSIYVKTSPFEIPLGSLLPVRVENLIAGGKAIGTTHITNACYRLHPIEWSIGEAAGTLASLSVDQERSVEAVETQAVQLALCDAGAVLHWPEI